MNNSLPEIKMVPLDAIHKNPKNPRIIKDEKFKKLVNSIIFFPKMSSKRQVIYDETGMILGGNMRYEAMLDISKKGRSKIESILKEKSTATKDLSGNIDILEPLFRGIFPEGWAICADDFTEDEKQEFVIKDNISGGSWNWESLAGGFELNDLIEWGFDEWELGLSPKPEVEVPEEKKPDKNTIKKCICPECGHEFEP